MTKSISRGGGAATAAGINYQALVTSWFQVHILAERDASPPWDFPPETTLDWLACETSNYPDDLLLGYSDERHVFCQIKRTVNVSSKPESPLGKSFDQFIRQYNLTSLDVNITAGYQKAFNRAKDTCLLIVGPKSSNPIKDDLPKILARIVSMPAKEPLRSAAHSGNEKKVLENVINLIEGLWHSATGEDAKEDDIRQFLACVRVLTLDVEQSGKDANRAEDMLRTAVLVDPTQSGTAWQSLTGFSQRLMVNSDASDLKSLHKYLLDESIALKSPHSYRDDITKLITYSENTASGLGHLSHIRVGDSVVKIERECTSKLREAIEHTSILVTGEPGAGKSGVLHALYRRLCDEKCDVLFFAIDQIITRTDDVIKNELWLSSELIDIIEHWPGETPGVILIDALDAARSNPVSTHIIQLIRKVQSLNSRWRIVASIREYDLRYSPRLQELFRGDPPTNFADPTFSNLKHLQVPVFSPDEMSLIASLSSNLKIIIESANDNLSELLRRPFNLRLVGELVGIGLDPDEIIQLQTSSSLLEKYWLHRVIGEDKNDASREYLLRIICEQMVSERLMKVQRSDIDGQSTLSAIEILLSNRVLMEWQPPKWNKPDRSNVVFSHHMLFDYAIFKLTLEGPVEPVMKRLESDPWLVVFYRPSLVYYFEFLWMIDDSEETFWDAILLITRSQNMPEVAKIIGPAVASEIANDISEFNPLLNKLVSEEDSGPGLALKHLFGALLTRTDGDQNLVGPNAGPWCDLVEQVSLELTSDTAFTVRMLLFESTKNPASLTEPQRNALGKAARRLLNFALGMVARNQWLVNHAIQSVCLTYESNIEESRELIKGLLRPEYFRIYGHQELRLYADSVKRLCDFDADLVEEIYSIAFSNSEPSDEITSMSDSKILGMTSTKRQDYSGGLYLLGEAFSIILNKAPISATRAMIAVVKSYVEMEHATPSGEIFEEPFQYKDRLVTLRQDYSSIWDQGNTYQHDPPIKMLDAFQVYISELIKKPEGIQIFSKILDMILKMNKQAVLWRRLLILGAHNPKDIGMAIAPLAWSLPILIYMDTSSQAGELLKTLYPILGVAEKTKIENAILSIPHEFPNKPDLAEHQRNRLLGCLDFNQLVTEDSKIILTELTKHKSIPENEPPVQIGRAEWGREYTDENFLADEGVAVDDPANKNVRVVEEPIKDFNKTYRNSNIEIQDALDVLSALQNLHRVLLTADHDGVDPKQKNHAMGELAATCANIADLDKLRENIELGKFVKEVLMEASNYSAPEPHPEMDAQFEGHPSWGGNQPRIEAAKGLIVLSKIPEFLDDELLTTIEILSDDDVPAVRFQIAIRLNAMYKTEPDAMWKILEARIAAESSNTILQWLIEHPIRRLERAELPKLFPIVIHLFMRESTKDNHEIQDACMGFFLSQFIWNAHDESEEVLFTSLEAPGSNVSIFNRALHQIREMLQHGQVSGHKPEDDLVRGRAIRIFAAVTKHSKKIIAKMNKDARSSADEWWTEERVADFRELHQLLDKVGSEIYFASGAFKAKQTGRAISPEEKRFYYEMRDIINEIASIGVPSLVHHLVETLEFFIPIEPEEVFLTLTQLIKSGKEWDYQFESLAIGVIVRIVERYFAEYREILQSNEGCQNGLIEILDTFVSVGWPEARRLTFRMEEIYR